VAYSGNPVGIRMFQHVLPVLGRFVGRKTHDAPPTEERRVWVRHPCSLATTVQAAGDAEPTPILARVRNVSHGGIMLVVGRRIEPGDLIRIDLPADSEGGESAVLACVLRVNPAGNEEWTLNCAFSADLSEHDWRVFNLEPPEPESERRAMIRYACHAQVIYEVMGGAQAQRGTAQLVNVSTGGIGFATAEAITLGSLLNLELRDSNGTRVAVMLASAVSTQRTRDGRCFLGCNFLGELSEQQLRELVKQSSWEGQESAE
jgi:hypothetical protein